MFEEFMNNKILPYIFSVSPHPMRFNELMKANKMHEDKMPLEGRIAGTKLHLLRAYIVMIVIWSAILLPITLIFHKFLEKIGCHIAILLAVFFTIFFFGVLSVFKQWAAEKMAVLMIKKAWKIHFPYYDYDEYHSKVAKFYTDAIERGVTGANLEMYIMNALSMEK